ncbi:DUF4105 domain-containing protein [Longimicrobium sp.]|jgi:hypothetical protein|uniref:lipoprotein N-acyltransferase Lnb domain-containing protein n=1 Tax=Longimicrobium sp. TaxID=2029185 RepID=UPI002EDADABA
MWSLIALIVAVLVTSYLRRWLTARPSHDRQWRPDQATIPGVTICEGVVHVRNVRDFHYRPPGDPTPRFRERTVSLDQLQRVWYSVIPFRDRWRGLAHAFVTFEISGGEYVSISIEARKVAGRKYSLWEGALRSYELMILIAEERDMMGARAVAGRNRVHLYPLRLTPEDTRVLFLELVGAARAIEERPVFYNTITDNCTTRILGAIHRTVPNRVPATARWVFPGLSDRLLHKCGLLDTDLKFEQARHYFDVTERVRAFITRRDFSTRIRT